MRVSQQEPNLRCHVVHPSHYVVIALSHELSEASPYILSLYFSASTMRSTLAHLTQVVLKSLKEFKGEQESRNLEVDAAHTLDLKEGF